MACGSSDEPEIVEPGLYYIGNEALSAILNDENDDIVFIYIGRPTCPLCVEFEPILDEALAYLERPLKYFQTDLARADDEEQMLFLLEKIGITGIPIIVALKDDGIRDYIMGVYTMEEVLYFFESNGGL